MPVLGCALSTNSSDEKMQLKIEYNWRKHHCVNNLNAVVCVLNSSKTVASFIKPPKWYQKWLSYRMLADIKMYLL
ncbi:hypothetical protein INR49_023609 [Caranx melampygus]|nr:hypothetical protein INR49_023609 [Caranx melampygus]